MITQERLKELIDYDENTGIFTWKKQNGNRIKIGTIAGSLKKEGYRTISIDSKIYREHRLAWLYVYGKFPIILDHINRIKNDNRLCNLREVTQEQNQWNASFRNNNISRIKGIQWDKQRSKWRVAFNVNRKVVCFGRFVDFFEACCVAISLRNKYHGEFSTN